MAFSVSTGCEGNRRESKKRLMSQKKRKRKRCDEEEGEEEPSVAEDCSQDTSADHPKHLKTEQAGQKMSWLKYLHVNFFLITMSPFCLLLTPH